MVLLNAYNKMWEDRNKLKKELLNKTEPELEDLENSPPIYVAKNEKACSKENSEGVDEPAFDKEISMGVNHEFNPEFNLPLQQKPE